MDISQLVFKLNLRNDFVCLSFNFTTVAGVYINRMKTTFI